MTIGHTLPHAEDNRFYETLDLAHIQGMSQLGLSTAGLWATNIKKVLKETTKYF